MLCVYASVTERVGIHPHITVSTTVMNKTSRHSHTFSYVCDDWSPPLLAASNPFCSCLTATRDCCTPAVAIDCTCCNTVAPANASGSCSVTTTYPLVEDDVDDAVEVVLLLDGVIDDDDDDDDDDGADRDAPTPSACSCAGYSAVAVSLFADASKETAGGAIAGGAISEALAATRWDACASPACTAAVNRAVSASVTSSTSTDAVEVVVVEVVEEGK